MEAQNQPPTQVKTPQTPLPTSGFSGYEKFVVAVLTFLQFTIILDFMILSPLGATLLEVLNLTPSQFGFVVSAYAFSAGGAGLLAAGFADRFDRKKLLLFFYSGFVLGTFLCGIAQSYEFLLFARIVTGLFGGVVGSVVYAITTDTFPLEKRGRVMGFLQTAFAASQVMGIPLGLYFSNLWGWHAPFLMIVGVSAGVGLLIWYYLKPINAHLALKNDRNPFQHLAKTITSGYYLQAFASTALLSTGGFMLMPFGSAFSVHNLGIGLESLPFVYMCTGVTAIIAGPFIGKLCDSMGKFPIFVVGSLITIAMVFIYTHLGITPIWGVIAVSTIMFVGISSRMISAMALISAIPTPADRGSFMSVNSSLQQISGGIAAAIAGAIIVQHHNGPLERFDWVGYVVILATTITIFMMYKIQRRVAPPHTESGRG